MSRLCCVVHCVLGSGGQSNRLLPPLHLDGRCGSYLPQLQCQRQRPQWPHGCLEGAGTMLTAHILFKPVEVLIRLNRF